MDERRVRVVLILFALVNVCSLAEASLQSDCQELHIVGFEPNKWVCVCDEISCDEFSDDDDKWPKEVGHAVQVVSSRSGRRFHLNDGHLIVSNQTVSNDEERKRINHAIISLDLDSEKQPILGWGGAITDSAAMNIYSLSSKNLSLQIIKSYYGSNGLHYNFGRVPIGGTDFSARQYTYNDFHPFDYGQGNWSLAIEDLEYKIPIIKEAQQLCKARNVQLKLLSSIWSAPAWMKTSKNIVKGRLINEYRIYRSFIKYLMKFYRAYLRFGVKFWGATVQNEPYLSTIPQYSFNSMNMNAKQMIKFIKHYLGPALEAEGMGPDKFKLIVGDDSFGLVEEPIIEILNDTDVQHYVSGFAFHWYTSGSEKSYNRLTKLYNRIKDKIEFMIMTEACNGFLPFQKKVDLGSWNRGENYAFDIIQDMLRQTGAWFDWNLALNPRGGPNWARNFVDSPIIVDTIENRFFKQPMYYVLAHFTRFFRPGFIRISSQIDDSMMKDNGLYVIAVKSNDANEEQYMIVNILNISKHDSMVNILLDSQSNGKQEIKAVPIEGKSINSIIVRLS